MEETRAQESSYGAGGEERPPSVAAFGDRLVNVDLRAPKVPYLSSLTGNFIEAREATDPQYWLRQLEASTGFAQAQAKLAQDPHWTLLEAGSSSGPGAWERGSGSVGTLGGPSTRFAPNSFAALLERLGRLWLQGVGLDWSAFHSTAKRRRLPLPTYPFERRRYWLEPRDRGPAAANDARGRHGLEGRRVEPSEALAARASRPGTGVEERVIGIFQELLGQDSIGRGDDFFALGATSLQVPHLLARLKQEFGKTVEVDVLLAEPTPAAIAQALRLPASGRDEPELPPVVTTQVLEREAVLDPSIASTPGLLAAEPRPTDILLTGATGFVGTYLLAALLEQTRANLHCLVRASDPRQAYQRLQRRLEARGLWQPSLSERLFAVPADLSAPNLALDEATYSRLSRKIDVIYHCGALVNYAYSYGVLKPANVLGTEEVLRLACRVLLKPVHFVSTTAVFPPAGSPGAEVIAEGASLEHGRALHGGYAQSKWVAERLCALAAARGVPVYIYRPGRVSGDSRTGQWHSQDLFRWWIRTCIELQAAPEIRLPINLAPVDYVARAILHLSRRSAKPGTAYHLVNPRSVLWHDLVEWLRCLGHPVRLVPVKRWQRLLEDATVRGALDDSSLAPLLLGEDSPFSRAALDPGAWPEFDCTQTLAGLEDSDISCPPVSVELIQKYLSPSPRPTPAKLRPTALAPPAQVIEIQD